MRSIEDQLILHEGLRLKPYKCPAGKWTVGVGRNLEAKGLTKEEKERILGVGGLSKLEVIDVLLERGISENEALFLLRNDIAEVTAQLERFDWFRALGPVRRKVLIDMCFNLGMAGLLGFQKMIEALKRADYERAADEMVNSKWYGQVGERGRRLERMMRTGEDY